VKGPVVEHPKLAEALRVKDGFELTGDRIRRTLAFLSHVGLVFWHHRLFHEQVIIRQEWALNAVYSVLDRRENSPVYRNLQKLKGRFTAEDLLVVDEGKRPVQWGKRYEKEEQDLLLSLMVRMGICFPLVREERSYWGKALYVSIAHLPRAAEARVGPRDESLPERFEFVRGERPVETVPIQYKTLHEGRWFAVLAQLGDIYGREGHYARNAFLLESNRDGQAVFIEMGKEVPGEKGGTMDAVTIHVVGKDASELAEQLQKSLVALLEGRKLPEGKEAGEGRGGVAGTPQHRAKVFISYARNEPKDGSPSSAIQKPKQHDYMTPVVALEKWANEAFEDVKWLKDDTDVEPGDSITGFINGAIETSDKILVVHSDRYWLSPHCMYEFTKAIDLGGQHGKRWGDLFLMVELQTSGIRKPRMDTAQVMGNARGSQSVRIDGWREYYNAWQAWGDALPVTMPQGVTEEQMKAAVLNCFLNHLGTLAGLKDIHWSWDPNDRKGFEKWLGTWFKREAGS
jgi:internalin A